MRSQIPHLAAGHHRLLRCRKTGVLAPGGAGTTLEYPADLPRHLLIGRSERTQSLEQDEVRDLLGKDPGIGRGDQRPERVAEQDDMVPPRRPDDAMKIIQPVHKHIGGRLVVRMTVTGQIDGDQLTPLKVSGQGSKALAVIEPTVKGKDQGSAGLPPTLKGDPAAIIEPDLAGVSVAGHG